MLSFLFVFSNFTNEQSPDCDLLVKQDDFLLSDKKSSLFALLVSVYNTAKKFLGYKLLSVILLFIYLFLTGPH